MPKNLPSELLHKVLVKLAPEDILSLALANKELNVITRDKLLWKNKYIKHFPHAFKRITMRSELREEKTDWHRIFRKTYANEYKGLSKEMRKLFSLVKENDTESLRKKNIDLAIWDIPDSNGKALSDWAPTQEINDYIYTTAQKAYAVAGGHTVDTQKIDHQQRTILYWSIRCLQSKEHIMLLLSQGSSVFDKYGEWYPFHFAAKIGNLGAMEALCNFYSRTRIQLIFIRNHMLRDVQNLSALSWAAGGGHLHIVNYLLQQPVLIWDAHHALHLAAINGHVSVAQALLTYDPELLNRTDPDGRTPLALAVIHEHSAMVGMLLSAGASMSISVFRPMRNVSHLAIRDNHFNVLQVLLKHKPEALLEMTGDGDTPLILAAACGRPHIVDYLLQWHDVGIDDFELTRRYTALHFAAMFGRSKIAHSLVKANADVTLSSRHGQMPIHLAAEEGRLGVVQVLLEHNPELLNQVDVAYGMTPLMWAAEGRALFVVEYLLQQEGINLEAVSNDDNESWRSNKTALQFATHYTYHHSIFSVKANEEVADVLIKAYARNGITLDSSKLIEKQYLNKRSKAELALLEYISNRSKQADYKKSFTLFRHTFNFGFSKRQKLAAANALKEVVFNGSDKSSLIPFAKELNNGELKSVYHDLKFSL